jgi:hypothetical protein
MVQGGSIANQTGNMLEGFIEDILIRKGYGFIDKKKFRPSVYLQQPIYTKQFYIGLSIYGTNIYCDFIIYHPGKHPDCLIIESKWQQAGGSVDEKYPYLIINIQTKYPHKTVLLLDGGGYKKGAEEWIRSQVGNNLTHVFNMSQFQTWVNKNNL